jgi:microcystin-dependent protein
MRLHSFITAAVAVLVTGFATTTAAAAPGPPPAATYVGEVRAFAFNFCPPGWLPADGSPMSIAQNQALFSLLGTSFGGNGVSFFNLPDLRGRAPVGTGPNESLGQMGSAQPGPQPAFLGMTWCIAVIGTFPQNGVGRPPMRSQPRRAPQ